MEPMRERLTFHFELRTRSGNFRFFFLFFLFVFSNQGKISSCNNKQLGSSPIPILHTFLLLVIVVRTLFSSFL